MLDTNQYINFPFDQLVNFNLIENQEHYIDIVKPLFSKVDSQNLGYTIDNIKFTFNLKRQKFSDHESVIIICSKNNGHILDHALTKLDSTKDLYQHDILLIDDRSDSDEILQISEKFNTSYLRVDNSSNSFNYSVINNIGAAYAKYHNKDLIIFYNNDLWPANEESLSNIIAKHKIYKSDLTGAKLIYPLKSDYEQLGKPPHVLDQYLEKLYNTIQHGGIHFGVKQSSFTDKRRTYLSHDIVLAPYHSWRFYENNEIMASYDTRCFAVTGALHIIDTNKFIDIGGLNCTMSTSFQDIDLCVRMLQKKHSIHYIGSESMYHAESITHHNEKVTQTKDFISDNIMWDYTYGLSLPTILGLQHKS